MNYPTKLLINCLKHKESENLVENISIILEDISAIFFSNKITDLVKIYQI